ncbi:FUSC family protein [Bradyrhizobium tropiciagri]|uniref:FUSC family protein n=1 Tax=Bradyrhizobium tropiciagri TaxID=312253 RepID=UPI00067DD2C1|nr:FUSC family protein [Bradyrhizobium tropiciagri]
MNQPSSFLSRHSASVFAVRTFAAAMVALSIALLLDMPRPYWAMASVYITSNELTGATSSKAVYRVLGTLIGATGTIVLIPNLVNAPELLSLAMALWAGVFLYFSLIDGTPRSYVFLLSGYTVALLGFPILSTPESTFDIVSTRVQEILLGIACASIASRIVLPRTVADTIAARAEAWLANMRQLTVDVLTGHSSDQEHDGERMRLAAAAAEIDQLSRHLGFETVTSANTVRGLELLRQRMLLLHPLLASIEARKNALISHGGVPPAIADVSLRIASWLANGDQDGQDADRLRAILDEVQPQLATNASWTEISAVGLAVRLRNLIDIMRDCRLLREATADGRDPSSLALALTLDGPEPGARHRDHGLASWAAAATALSVVACCAFWIATGWTDGASAALFAALVGSFLAGQDDPLPAFRKFFGVILVVIVVTGIYTFGILPRVTTFEMLVVALAPTFLLFGWMTARPATGSTGSWLAIFTSVQLALQSSYSADFGAFANSSISLMVGVALTATTCGIVRTLGAAWIANRLVRSNWRTLAAVAGRSSPQDRAAIGSLMQHRLALLAARITVVPAAARSDAANLLQLRTALNIIDVRHASLGLSHAAMAGIDALFNRLASAARTHTAGRLPDELIGRLDDAIASTLREPASKNRSDALIGLSGIRAGLFPAAGSYQPRLSAQGSIAA